MRKRTRYDWVYRPDAIGEGSPTTGTYQGAYTSSLPSGVLGATILVLYDSIDWLVEIDRTSNYITRAARAEGRQPMVGGVELDLGIVPDTWSENGALHLGWRVGFFEQDPSDGVPAVLPEYSMWAGPGVTDEPAVDANDTQTNIREGRFYAAFNASVTSPIFHIHRFLRFKRRMPGSRYCLGVYLESSPSSVGIRLFRNCRTLVADEG